MTFRIRLVTYTTDAGGMRLRDVRITDAWRSRPGDPLAAFSACLCEQLAMEGVSDEQLEKCTALNLWYVSNNAASPASLDDPNDVPDHSLIFFDTVSSPLTRKYTKPDWIHVYDLTAIHAGDVLRTQSPTFVDVLLDDGQQYRVNLPVDRESQRILPYLTSHLQMAGVTVYAPCALVANAAWDACVEFTGRHQLTGGNFLYITGRVEKMPASVPMHV